MDQIIALSDHIDKIAKRDDLHLSPGAIHVCEPSWSWNPPPLPDFDLWVILDGSGTLKINQQTYPLRTGMGFILQPGDRVAGTHDPDDPLTVFACHFLPAAHPIKRWTEPAIAFQFDDHESLRSRAEEAVRFHESTEPTKYLAEFIIREILLRGLLRHLKLDTFIQSSPIHQLASEVRSRPSEKWDLEAMASRCSLSVPQFTRRFRSSIGSSPTQYVILQRIRRAAHLLRESHISIQQIANSLGYSDHYFFHRQFKAITGRTPGEVRLGAEVDPDI